MSLCLAAGLLLAPIGEAVSVRWTHSIEKIVWEEDYVGRADGVRINEARIRGSGAGMEPPPGAVLRDGVWHYRPALPVMPRVLLRHSPHVAPYLFCAAGDCRPPEGWLPGLADDAVLELAPCASVGGVILP